MLHSLPRRRPKRREGRAIKREKLREKVREGERARVAGLFGSSVVRCANMHSNRPARFFALFLQPWKGVIPTQILPSILLKQLPLEQPWHKGTQPQKKSKVNRSCKECCFCTRISSLHSPGRFAVAPMLPSILHVSHVSHVLHATGANSPALLPYPHRRNPTVQALVSCR